MITKHDLWGRIRRLEQLTAGLNAELVRLAMGAEPLVKCEAEAYLEAVAEMTTSARTAAKALRTAVARLAREEERARGGPLWERSR
jgi:hypothetical protein